MGLTFFGFVHRFEKATPRIGWYYLLSRTTCRIGIENSLTQCYVNKDSKDHSEDLFYQVVEMNDYCNQVASIQKAKGVICDV